MSAHPVACIRFLHFGSLTEYIAAAAAVCTLRLAPFYAPARTYAAAPADPPADPRAPLCAPAAAAAPDALGHSTLVHADCAEGPSCRDYPPPSPPPPPRADPLEVLELNCRGCSWTVVEGGGGGGGGGGCRLYAEMCEDAVVSFSGGGGGSSLVVGLAEMGGLAEWPLPDGVSLDGRWLASGDFAGAYALLAYHGADSFKRSASLDALAFCGQPVRAWLAARGLAPSDIWTLAELESEAAGLGVELWTARLFPLRTPLAASETAGGDCALAARFTWLAAGVYSAAAAAADSPSGGVRWRDEFRAARRVSIALANDASSVTERDARRRRLRAAAAAPAASEVAAEPAA